MRIQLAIVGLIFVASTTTLALDSPLRRNSLRGAESVIVEVEPLDEDARKLGFDEKQLQTDVALKLRLAGIDIAVGSTTVPILWVGVSVLPVEVGRSLIALRLDFTQTVALKRDSRIVVPAETWSVGRFGISDGPAAREQLKGLADQFANAWLSVNPKK